MPNLTTTNNDIGNVILEGGATDFEPGLLTVAGAVTVLEGTILARDSGTLKFVPFVKGGVVNENGIPKAVLTYEIVSAGAGDESLRAMVNGKVRTERLIIDADGDGSNVDSAVTDELRDYGITVISVTELNSLDNQ